MGGLGQGAWARGSGPRGLGWEAWAVGPGPGGLGWGAWAGGLGQEAWAGGKPMRFSIIETVPFLVSSWWNIV